MDGRASVLVVDDDPKVLVSVSTALENAGYLVTTETDAARAVARVQGMKIGLIISDIMMPWAGTGLNAIGQLRAALPGITPRLPVIFMTGLEPDKARALVSSDDPHVRLISKPIDLEALRSAIKELTGVDRALSMERRSFVLVVDDDPAILALVSAALENAGYLVTTAANAAQEVVQAQGMRVGLIISDIMMPGVSSGVDAVKQLRVLPWVTPRLPVIFMTGLAPDKARALIPPDPYVRLITKPIDFGVLRATIKELTGVDWPLG